MSGEISYLKSDIRQKNETIKFFVEQNQTKHPTLQQFCAMEDNIKHLFDENKHLIDLITFSMNQLNRRNTLTTSTEPSNQNDDSSVFLEEIYRDSRLKSDHEMKNITPRRHQLKRMEEKSDVTAFGDDHEEFVARLEKLRRYDSNSKHDEDIIITKHATAVKEF